MRKFPIPRPADDKRFTLGLTLDLAAVLARHGYPSIITSAEDLTNLQLALFRFLYAAPAVPAASPPPCGRCGRPWPDHDTPEISDCLDAIAHSVLRGGA